jgi:hypothetical protein
MSKEAFYRLGSGTPFNCPQARTNTPSEIIQQLLQRPDPLPKSQWAIGLILTSEGHQNLLEILRDLLRSASKIGLPFLVGTAPLVLRRSLDSRFF